MPLCYLVNAQGFQIHLQLFSLRIKASVLCHSTHPHMLLGNPSQVRNKSAFNVVMKKALNDLTDDERYNLWIKAYHAEGLQVQLLLTRLPDSLLQLLIPPSLSPSTRLCIFLPSLLSFYHSLYAHHLHHQFLFSPLFGRPLHHLR